MCGYVHRSSSTTMMTTAAAAAEAAAEAAAATTTVGCDGIGFSTSPRHHHGRGCHSRGGAISTYTVALIIHCDKAVVGRRHRHQQRRLPFDSSSRYRVGQHRTSATNANTGTICNIRWHVTMAWVVSTRTALPVATTTIIKKNYNLVARKAEALPRRVHQSLRGCV